MTGSQSLQEIGNSFLEFQVFLLQTQGSARLKGEQFPKSQRARAGESDVS